MRSIFKTLVIFLFGACFLLAGCGNKDEVKSQGQAGTKKDGPAEDPLLKIKVKDPPPPAPPEPSEYVDDGEAVEGESSGE